MLFLALAIFQFSRLHVFDSPTGADGFFYLKQIQSLSEQGVFYYKDYSLAFLFPTLLNFFLKSPLLSYQISTCFTYAGLAFVTWKLLELKSGFNSRRAVYGFQVLLALLFFFSNFFFELNFTFQKTAWGLLCFMLGLLLVEKGKVRTALIFFLLGIFCHKIVFAPILLLALLQSFKLSRKKILIGLGFAATAAASVLAVYPRIVQQLEHQWSRLSYEKFDWFNIAAHPEEFISVSVFLVLGLIYIFLNFKNKKTRDMLLIFISYFLSLPLLFPDLLGTDSTSYRFLVFAIPFFFLLLLYFMRQIFFRSGYVVKAIAVAGFAAVILFQQHWQRPLKTWINPWAKRAAEAAHLAEALPADALLYAPHGMEFYLAYVTPLRPRSLILPPSDPLTQRPTYRVAYVAPYLKNDGALKDDMEQMTVFKLSEDFRVFNQEDWISLNIIHQFIPHPINLLESKPEFVANYDN